ncbi:MAG: glutamyl-tRNA reductase, partial [SAR324 cluster bacterium]|nr:glutamyl-tRNA reductase [SAR324 cluster bacterium]
ELPDSDIVISSTGAREPILTPERVRQSLRKRRGRPMFFIDIAVPRDIDPTVNELSGVYCYDIDDLQGVVEQNREERREQSNLAEEIIRKELQKVMLWFETQSVIPTVKSLRESFQETVDVELEKTLAKLGSLNEKQQAEVEKMVRVLTNKLLHKPSTRLKDLSVREDLHLYLETLSELFDLNPSNNVEEASPQPALKLLKKQ